MEREVIDSFIEWKERAKRKPLMVTGVRQCGKTHLLKAFGQRCFEQVAYFNFERSQALHSIFDFDMDVKRIIRELSAIAHCSISENATLVIFDEIQACPKAITSLKYFCEDMPNLHVACAGSLLGVALGHQNISFPVGKIERCQMYPLSFKEFLMADGFGNMIEAIEQFALTREIPEAFSVPLAKALKNYYIVGGMPEAVNAWVETHNYEEVEKIQRSILADYADDFAKHALTTDIPKLGWIWDSVPQQLAKENNKFVFSHVKAGKRSAELEDALKWLENAGLIYRLELVENPEFPLTFHANSTHFKVYMCDVGLLRCKSNISARTIIEESPLYYTFKGAFAENFVMSELIKQHIKPYFWKSNTAELDFLMEHNEMVIPIEAKAELNTKAKSYTLFCSRYKPRKGFKVSMRNVGDNWISQTLTFSLPLYLLWKMKQYI